jgi:hypothetical protein
MAHFYSLLVLLLAALTSTAAGSDWSFEDAKLTISSIDGSARASERWVEGEASSIELLPSGSLILSFFLQLYKHESSFFTIAV